MTIRAHRFVAAGALTVAAVAAPIAFALVGVDNTFDMGSKCLSSVTTNGSDPICVGYSNGTPHSISTPGGVYGPNTGIQTGQLLPGQTWDTPIA